MPANTRKNNRAELKSLLPVKIIPRDAMTEGSGIQYVKDGYGN